MSNKTYYVSLNSFSRGDVCWSPVLRGACADGEIVEAGMPSDARNLHPRHRTADHQTTLETQKWGNKQRCSRAVRYGAVCTTFRWKCSRFSLDNSGVCGCKGILWVWKCFRLLDALVQHCCGVSDEDGKSSDRVWSRANASWPGQRGNPPFLTIYRFISWLDACYVGRWVWLLQIVTVRDWSSTTSYRITSLWYYNVLWSAKHSLGVVTNTVQHLNGETLSWDICISVDGLYRCFLRSKSEKIARRTRWRWDRVDNTLFLLYWQRKLYYKKHLSK